MKKILETLRNKWAEYLLEMVVIVFGILLAFTLNSWNEQRKQEELEGNFLYRINVDLNKDKRELKRIINIQLTHKKNLEFLLKSLEPGAMTNKKELDSAFLIIYSNNPTFYPIVGSYQSALSSGTLGVVENDEFLTRIIRLYDYYGRLDYNSKNLDNVWLQLNDKYKFERRTKQLKIESLKEPMELLNDLFRHLSAINFYVDRCNEALQMIDEVLMEN